jgi:hypothetical protein
VRARLFGRKRRASLDSVKVPARAEFPIDDRLIQRQLDAAQNCPVNGIKRVLIEDQADTFVPPLPIG